MESLLEELGKVLNQANEQEVRLILAYAKGLTKIKKKKTSQPDKG